MLQSEEMGGRKEGRIFFFTKSVHIQKLDPILEADFFVCAVNHTQVSLAVT